MNVNCTCGVRQTLEHLLVECWHIHSFWNLLTSWWNSCNLPKVTLSNNAKIYAHQPEKRSFHAVNLCLIVARCYIYTAAKESESSSIAAFKVLLKSKLSRRSHQAFKHLRAFRFLLIYSMLFSIDFICNECQV